MAQGKPRKPFVAELMRAQGKLADHTGYRDDGALARHEEVLAAIGELRTFICEVGRQPQPAMPADGLPDPLVLRRELEAVRDSILNTKKEIAAVRHPGADSDRLLVAADELDAVVAATEQATHVILESAETLDEMAERVKQASNDSFITQTVDEMRELIVKVFEACNFQDITGQRITKVVTTVKFIEDRVNAMIDIWGKESFTGIEVPKPVVADPDHDLLSGPQPPKDGVSQADIDKLFG
jgi:chemotaxis protein CheZ